ncbi:hypothetical protein K2Z84_14435 [Candidatus Binatia bacterium]|nr:hypothetical protein [Candidatus Binatia bacterium]
MAWSAGLLSRYRPAVVVLLATVGLYFPSSMHGAISPALSGAQALVSAALLLLVMAAPGGLLGTTSLALVLGANALLWLFTSLTPLPGTALGAGIYYGLTSILLCTRVRSVRCTRLVRSSFFVFNVVNLVAAAAIVAQVPSVIDFVAAHYGAFYDSLVRNMLAERKPVLAFGSHSVAAFFMFLFFLANFERYVGRGGMLSFVTAITYLVALATLRSSTAVVLLGVALVHVLLACRRRPIGTIMLSASSTLLGAFAVSRLHADPLRVVTDALATLWADEGAGFGARYSATGLLAGNLAFLRQNAWPVGFGFGPGLFFGDSGYVEMTLRGSLVLPLLLYSAFGIFLLHNLRSRALALELLAVFLAFEIGWGNLIYVRTVGLLPLLIVLLNDAGYGVQAPTIVRRG